MVRASCGLILVRSALAKEVASSLRPARTGGDAYGVRGDSLAGKLSPPT